MNGYVVDIEKMTLENKNFRKVLYTTKLSQLVVMSLNPGEDIGEEIHHLDQFIRCEEGEGKAILDGVTCKITQGFAVIVPSGTKHNILNTSKDRALKLYTVYSPPNHREGVVHLTKADALRDEEHFDGHITK